MGRGLSEQAKEEFFLNETWASVVFGLDGEVFEWDQSHPSCSFFSGALGFPALYIWS